MPFIEGESLRDRLAKDGALPVPEAARIFREVVDALGEAHRRGVVHRDVKPANVLHSGGHALVADFGVAKAVSESADPQRLTTLGVVLGTPQYMAPEQAAADPAADQRADLFAAGVIAYEMLTGTSPFAAPSVPAVFRRADDEIPEPPHVVREAVPKGFSVVVMACMEKDPGGRPQSATELLTRLHAVVTPTAQTAAAPHAAPRIRRSRLAGVAVLVAATPSVHGELTSSARSSDGRASWRFPRS